MPAADSGESYAELAAQLADARHIHDIDQKLIDRLYADGEVDRELIIALRAQGAADRDALAALELQTARDQADIAGLKADAIRDAQQITGLEAQGILDREAVLALTEQGVLDRDNIANLEKALASARLIGAAIGIIMAHLKITQDAAFYVMVAASQRSGVKLREIADRVLFTGKMPD